MSHATFLMIRTKDNQNYEEIVRIRIKDGSFDGTVLPLTTKLEPVIAALFGTTVIADQIVSDYWVEVHADPTVLPLGGNGNVATPTYAKTRNDIYGTDFVFSIPGVNKANLAFDPSNPNAIAVTDALWTGLRGALTDAAIAWSAPTGAYAAVSSAHTVQVASVLQGKRAPKRVR